MSKRPDQSAEAYHYDTSIEGIGPTRRSAEIIASLLMKRFEPKSVVDFGCGLGDWLAQFRALGCERVLGLDGPWVPLNNLQIPPESFRCVDFAQDYDLGAKFDMAMSFEVAEHMPDDAGMRLVKQMTQAADLLVFGAAIPEQGGYMHVNERYQSYWISRFADHGYAAFDLVRPTIWMNQSCCWWYQQNIIVYANAAAQERYGLKPAHFIADIVHPAIYDWHRNPTNWSGRVMARMLLKKLMNRLIGSKPH
jgi:hypothetical protein